ncbi:restriction endonuclease subunit S [Prevotella sp.]|uniref:restriction endonuclease subunit S n=1 Tax=Prevotella sp. TaxID=59823 RepID=UPI004026E4A7
MKKYNAYKDSGVKWIGEIPSHWGLRRAKYMFNKEKREVRDIDDVVTCFRDGEVTLRKNRRTTGFTESFTEIGYQGVRKGDLVIHQMDAFAGSIGVSDSDGKCTSVYHCCTPKGSYDAHYYAHLVRLMAKRGYIQSLYRGIRERSSDFKFPVFGNQFLAIPPLHEQQVIVDYLKDKTLKIEQYVSARERERELLDSLKQSEIANIVTKGLNPNVKMKDSGIPWIGEIPEHWEVKRWGNAFKENKDINSNLENTTAFQFNYGSLVKKKREYKEEEDAETYAKYTILKPKDIVINGLNLNYDFVSQRVAISDDNGIITSAYISMHPRNNVEAQYFCYLFKTMDAMKLFHGMGTGIRLTLSFAELKKQYIPIPPLSEQQAIVAYIDEKLQKIDQYMTDLQREIDYLKEFKQRLISDAVTGQLCITNQ